jgi:hypothetical protein
MAVIMSSGKGVAFPGLWLCEYFNFSDEIDGIFRNLLE